MPWTVIHYINQPDTLVHFCRFCLFVHYNLSPGGWIWFHMMLICPAQSYTDHFTSTCGWRQCIVIYSHRKGAAWSVFRSFVLLSELLELSKAKSLILTIACYVDPNLGCLLLQSALELKNIGDIQYNVLCVRLCLFPIRI